MTEKVIFVPMCADFLHVGHINILEGAASYGDVHVLLMTDQAMESYKRAPYMSYKERERILLSIQYVEKVVPCSGPHTYADLARKYKPDFFCHGDDWKTGPQAQGRLEVAAELEKYGGIVVEPAYTSTVSSTAYQKMFHTDINESKHTGVLVRTALNDLKRVPEAIEEETGLPTAVLSNLINGQDFDQESVRSVLRLIHQNYPCSMKHLVVDRDNSDQGVWHMTAKQSYDCETVN